MPASIGWKRREPTSAPTPGTSPLAPRVPFIEASSGLHRRRAFAYAVIAAALLARGIAGGGFTDRSLLGASIALVALAHALLGRPRWKGPGLTWVIDLSAVAALFALSNVRGLALLVPALYLFQSGFLYLPRRMSGVAAGAVLGILGVAFLVRDPGHLPAGLVDPAVEAAVSLVAFLPTVGFNLRRVDSAFVGLEALNAQLADLLGFHRSLVESTPDGIVVVDPTSVVRFANPAASRILGSEALAGSSLREFLVDRSWETHTRVLAALLESPSTSSGPFEVEILSGRRLTAEVSYGIVEGPSPEVLMVIRDVTAYTEERERNRFLLTALEHISEAVCITDPRGRVVFWNAAAERMFSLAAQDVLGKQIIAAIHPLDPATLTGVMDALAGSGTWRGETRFVRPDGSSFPVYGSWTVIRDLSADRVEGYVGIAADLTELETSLREARRLAEISRAALERAPFPTAVVGPDGRIRMTNTQWRRLAALGMSPLIHGEDGAFYIGHVQEVAEGHPDLQAFLDDLRLVEGGGLQHLSHRHHDEARTYLVDMVALAEGDIMLAFHDVSSIERERAEMEEQLEERDHFLAKVAHQLRTPLTAVLGLASALHQGLAAPDERRELVRLLARQTREMALLVENLLLLGRLEQGVVTVRPERIDLSRELRRAAAELEPTDGLDVRCRVPELTAWTDPLRLRQILANLIDNSNRHARNRIEIRASLEGELAIVDVIDDGPGVPVEIEHDIFEPYVADAQAAPGRLGIGLYLVRRLVHMMGGDVRYLRTGELTVFRLTLPVAGPKDRRQGPGVS